LQKEYQPTPSDEKILKGAAYDINSKEKKKEAKPVVGTRKNHTRDKKSLGLSPRLYIIQA